MLLHKGTVSGCLAHLYPSKVKTYLIIILLIICRLPVFCQINYFHKIYPNDTSTHYTIATIPQQDGTYYTLSLQSGIVLHIIDEMGNIEQTKIIDYGSDQYGLVEGEQFIRNAQGGYTLVYRRTVAPGSTDKDIYMVFLDADGNPTGQPQHYGEPDATESPLQVLQTSDNGYLIVGQQYYNNEYSHFYLVKTDSVGGVVWTNTYTTGNTGSSVPFTALERPDGGYMLSGYGHYPIWNYQTIVCAIDAAGNWEWTRNYGSVGDDGAGMLTQQSDTTYFLYGLMREGGMRKIFLSYLNNGGDTIWRKKYIMSNYTSSQAYFLKKSDNRYYAAGLNQDPTTSELAGVLLAFDGQGDTLWTRQFTSNPAQEHYLRDIDFTPDGGIILTGFVYDQPTAGWLIKTDSLGNTCAYVGCDSTSVVGVGWVPAAAPDPPPYAVVYAAPALELRSLVLSATATTFNLYDLQGRTAMSRFLHPAASVQHIDAGSLPAGIYVYTFADPNGGIVQRGKVAVW
jgi:hypothetical protein